MVDQSYVDDDDDDDDDDDNEDTNYIKSLKRLNLSS